MSYIIKNNAPSIEECMKIVADLHTQGYTKEQITLVTNNACKEAIISNLDLRGKNGAVFSTHSLLDQIKYLFNLKQFEEFQKETHIYPGGKEFLGDHLVSVENGNIVIITEEPDEGA